MPFGGFKKSTRLDEFGYFWGKIKCVHQITVKDVSLIRFT